jgi:hypothetical protein
VRTFSAHGRTFSAKRLGRSVWHLRDHAVGQRSRFGTRREIMADIAYVLEAGCLPPASGPRW